MNKIQMAHEFAMKLAELKVTNKTEDIIRLGWEYANAMQAEADERECKERPEALCEVDWVQAPKNHPVTGWYIFKGAAHWICDDFPCGPAPSFGFTGSHIVERPQ